MQDYKVNITPVGDYAYSSPKQIYFPDVIKFHLETDSIYSEQSFSGSLKENVKEKEIIDYLNSIGAIHCYKTKETQAFKYADSLIFFHTCEKDASINLLSNSDKAIDAFEHIKKEFLTDSKKDLVFSIIKENNKLGIKSLGKANSPLIEENYNSSVIENLKYVKECFTKSPPTGRICILNGIAGTGKTHIIRSLLSDLDSIFVIIQSNMISSMDNPEFLPLLLDTKTAYKKPITLIIEDGDACLVPRKSDNMSSIASLLNLSDGIIGSLIDMRMVISTNSDVKEIDKAIMRPGRLCKNIDVNALEYEQANKVYQRLIKTTDKNLPKEEFYTLAEIYAYANNLDGPENNISVPKKNKKSIGFSNNHQLMNIKE